MANPLNARPFDQVAIDLRKAGFTEFSIRFLRDTLIRSDKVLTDAGAVQDVAPIVGRTEGLGTTAQNLDVTGKLVNTDAIAADGTGSPLTGGKRGFVALDTNNRLAGTFRNNPANVSATPGAATRLSNDGITTVVNVAADTPQFGDGTVSYGATSFDPGVFGTFYAWIDDPTFSGGTIAPGFSTTPPSQTAANGRIPLGKITTVLGAAKTGGGYSGGTTTGGAGGRGYSGL